MKNTKNYKTLIANSLLVVGLVSTPFVGLANGLNLSGNGEGKVNLGSKVSTFVKANADIKAEANRENKEGDKEDREDKKENRAETMAKLETKFETKVDKKSSGKNNSVWARLAAFFGNRTEASVNVAPVISGITAPTVLKVGEQGTWKVKAYDQNNGSLSYSVSWGDETTPSIMSKAAGEAFFQTSTFTHTYNAAGDYTATFTVTDDQGVKATSTATVHVVVSSPDTTLPIMSNLELKITMSGAMISWKTDEATKAQVFYGTNTPIDINSTSTLSVSDASVKKNHSLRIPALAANTLYNFVLKSTDASGNVKVSSEFRFVTSGM